VSVPVITFGVKSTILEIAITKTWCLANSEQHGAGSQRHDTMDTHGTFDRLDVELFQELRHYDAFSIWHKNVVDITLWLTDSPCVKVISILNTASVVFDCTVSLSFGGAPNTITWAFPVTRFELLPWNLYTVEHVLMISNQIKHMFVLVLARWGICNVIACVKVGHKSVYNRHNLL